MGIDYFPQDSAIYQDRKIRRLIGRCGPNGFLVYDYIKTECYRTNGYWLGYDGDLCFDIADVFRVAGLDGAAVAAILDVCLHLQLFDEGVFASSSVITSADIQARYLEVKKIPLIWHEVWLGEPLVPSNTSFHATGTLSTENCEQGRGEKENALKKIKQKMPADDCGHTDEKRSGARPRENGLDGIRLKKMAERMAPPLASCFKDLRQLRDILLADDFFMETMQLAGVKPAWISGWLDAFNRKLTFENKIWKEESDYRSHFARWLRKVPGYNVLNPAGYLPIGDALPLPDSVKKMINSGDEKIKKLLRR